MPRLRPLGGTILKSFRYYKALVVLNTTQGFPYRAPLVTGESPLRNVTNAILDDVRDAKGLTSDYALAKLLGVGPAAISNYRRGVSQMSDRMALKVARILGRPAALILVQIAAERTDDPEVAQVWKEAAKILSRSKAR